MRQSKAKNRHKNQDERVVVQKMSFSTKICYALLVCTLSLILTKGIPERSNHLAHAQISDEKLEYIYETVIAVQTKTIRATITESNEGIWKFIAQKMNLAKWAEIQVKLKTNIGIRLNSITYDMAYNNVHIDFGQPCVLGRTYTTKVIKTSDNFFSSWSIMTFQQHKDEYLKEVLDNQSNNLVDIFKSDKKKMRELQKQYYNSIQQYLTNRHNQIGHKIIVWKVNKCILDYLSTIFTSDIFPSINTSYLYTKNISKNNLITKIEAPLPERKIFEKRKFAGSKIQRDDKIQQLTEGNNRKSEKQILQRQKIRNKILKQK